MSYPRSISLILIILILAACKPIPITPTPSPAPPIPTLTPEPGMPAVSIARHPAMANFSFINPDPSLPKYNPASTDPSQIDYRSADLSALDLSGSGADLLYAIFDSHTTWPEASKMPAGFDWQKIMEIGKNPGLGMRALHAQGLTGKGIGIAIIDQTLLVDHIEYRSRLRLYEEYDDAVGAVSSMHAPAVASIAVGKTLGVAPEADLYFIATGTCGFIIRAEDLNFDCHAKAVRRVIAINQGLPESRKIRVLSMSIGWTPQSKGYAEITSAVEAAKAAGIFVISTSLSDTDGLYFNGLGRTALDDPDKFTSYLPGSWWSSKFYAGQTRTPQQILLVPMESRSTASPTGPQDYVHYPSGGASWAVPYLAGTYALAAQVKPDVTPEEFWATALQTGQTIQIAHDGKTYTLGTILDPQALIAALHP